MGSTTIGALSALLLLVALGYNMPHLLAPITPGNAAVRVRIMEDGHFDRSPSTRWKWGHGPNNSGRFHKGRLNWGVTRAYRDWVDEAIVAVQFLIRVADLQPLFAEFQLPFHGHQLLHNLHDASLGILHQLLQGVLEVAQAPIAINFPKVFRVIYLGERHVDGKFPVAPILQMPPLDRVHGDMRGDPPIDKDRARPSFSANTGTPFYMSIVGGVLDVGGNNEPLLGPVGLVGAVLRVPDIDAVVEWMVRDIINESRRWGKGLVFFIGLFWVFVIDFRVLVVVVLSHGQRATA